MIVLRVMFQVCGHEGHGANPQPGAASKLGSHSSTGSIAVGFAQQLLFLERGGIRTSDLVPRQLAAVKRFVHPYLT